MHSGFWFILVDVVWCCAYRAFVCLVEYCCLCCNWWFAAGSLLVLVVWLVACYGGCLCGVFMCDCCLLYFWYLFCCLYLLGFGC